MVNENEEDYFREVRKYYKRITVILLLLYVAVGYMAWRSVETKEPLQTGCHISVPLDLGLAASGTEAEHQGEFNQELLDNALDACYRNLD